MHRVVCCYPDHESLVGAAAQSAGRLLVFSYPRSTWWTRVGAVAANLFLRARRCCYRTYVHPPSALIADAEREGLRLAYEHEGFLWRVAGFERAS
jgi:magnesium-protoporphyrin O-methyltransferase